MTNPLKCTAKGCNEKAAYLSRETGKPLCYRHWHKEGYRHCQIGGVMLGSEAEKAKKKTIRNSKKVI